MTKHRSAASLLASGVASITLHHRMKMPRVTSTKEALAADKRALDRDGKRVQRRVVRELDPA